MGDVQKKLQELSDSYQALQGGEEIFKSSEYSLMAGQNSPQPWKLAKSWSRSNRRTLQSKKHDIDV